MTLVVARTEGGKVHVTSDTLVTKINGERFSYDKCIVKAVLVNVQCCICFAGNVDAANKAISHLIDKNYNCINKILSYLEKIHNKYNQSVDFGVITNIDEELSLHSLKSGEALTNVKQFWLGEHFNEFQIKFGEFPEDTPLKDKMNQSMISLIQDGNINAIGGFDLSISSDNESFQFEDENGKRPISGLAYDFRVHHSITGPQIITFEKAGECKPIKGGTDDSISVFSSTNPYYPGAGIHYKHAKNGYLFCPHLRIKLGQPELVLEPFVYTNVDPECFLEKITSSYGIGLKGFVVGDEGRLTLHNEKSA
ncbi:MAG: hypothetical protein ACJAS1_005620 [Oleiphilaceae bacterium]|jgi:hypothetical protein